MYDPTGRTPYKIIFTGYRIWFTGHNAGPQDICPMVSTLYSRVASILDWRQCLKLCLITPREDTATTQPSLFFHKSLHLSSFLSTILWPAGTIN